MILPVHLSAASAEKRTFIIANNPDGYGVDRCLAHGAACGAAAAAAYCQSKRFAGADSYRKIERDEITGAVPASGSCRGAMVATNSSQSSAGAERFALYESSRRIIVPGRDAVALGKDGYHR